MFCFFCKQKTAYEMRISDWSSDVCSSDLRCDRSIKVAVARDHQHRDRRIAPFDLVEQVEPVQPRALEPDVEQDPRRAPGRDRLERGIAVRRVARLIALVLEHASHEFADIEFVIDDENVERHNQVVRFLVSAGSGRSRASSASDPSPVSIAASIARSKVIVTFVPPPSRSVKVTVPKCSSTIFLTIARPRPVPRDRVVMYGSTSRWRSIGRPTPSSATSIVTLSCSASSESRITTLPSARSAEHPSELQSLMRLSYTVFCLKKKKRNQKTRKHIYKRATRYECHDTKKK